MASILINKNHKSFIEKVKEIINMQVRNEDRAVFGKGHTNFERDLKNIM